MIDRLKKIIEEEYPNNIPPEPPAEMHQRPQLPILEQIVTKVKKIDNKMNEGNVKLIKALNQMFKEYKAMVDALLFEMQPKEGPSLFELQESKQKIERLFEFIRTYDSNTTFPFWCVGVVINVSNGTNILK